MIGYETEEQQVQAIKQFWKDNGFVIIAGAVIGLALLWGWRYYNDATLQAQEEASSAYQAGLESLVENENPEALNTFVSEQADTGYAPLAAMILAQQAVEKEDYAAAKDALSKAIAGEDEISDVARLRLADLHIQLAEYEQALAVLDAVTAQAFEGQVAELRGDALLAQGKFQEAKDAYTVSIAQSPNNPNIKLKRDNIAFAKSKAAGDNVE